MGGFYFVRDWFNPFLQNNYAGKAVDIRGFIIMDAVMEYNNKENSQTFPDGEMPLVSIFPVVHRLWAHLNVFCHFCKG